jgi:hypothetical protein
MDQELEPGAFLTAPAPEKIATYFTSMIKAYFRGVVLHKFFCGTGYRSILKTCSVAFSK